MMLGGRVKRLATVASATALAGVLGSCGETPTVSGPEPREEVIEQLSFARTSTLPMSAASVLAVGNFDQGLIPVVGGSWLCSSIGAPGRARAQTFVPTLPTIETVQLWLLVQENFPDPTLLVSLREGSPAGSELAFATAVAPAATTPDRPDPDSPIEFDFPSAIRVTPGRTYSIVVRQVMPTGEPRIDGNALVCRGESPDYEYPDGESWYKFDPAPWTVEPGADLFFATFGGTETLPVSIDIKPGSDRNPVNTRSRGVVPVAVLGSALFDVTDVNITTLAFGPGEAKPAHDGTHGEEVDVNGDGFMDLVSHFRQKEVGWTSADTEACLKGETLSGKVWTGCDLVTVR